jgi:hypothetical protein
MSKNIKNIIKNRVKTLLETKGFEDMEVAFGVKHKSDNLSDAEKAQFGSLETIQDKETGLVNLGSAKAQPALDKVHRKDLVDAEEYYKMVLDKMENFQETSESEPSQIGESFKVFIKEEGDDYYEQAIEAAKKMYEYIKSNNIPTRIDVKGKPEGDIDNYNFIIVANPSENNRGEIRVFGRGTNEDVIKNYVNHVKDKFNKEYGDLFDSSDIHTEKRPNGLITMSFILVKKRSEMSEAFEPKKVNREDDQTKPEEVYDTEALGPGMLALRYDNEGTPVHDEFVKRQDELNGNDSTYQKLRGYSEKYLKHKYGTPDEYHYTPKVRTTDKPIAESENKYSDVTVDNIFKTKGEINSKEQVLRLTEKLPSRVKIDETVFAITDGNNYYRLIWEGEEDGEAVITHEKNTQVVSESIEKMKHLWGYNSSKTMSTKNIVKENEDDNFKKVFRNLKNK